MYCRYCGKEISEDSVTCIHCGANVKPAVTKTETNTLAIVGFVLSFFVALAGLICSIIGYRNAKQNDADGKGLALAGIIISGIQLAGIVLSIVIYIGVIIAAISATGGLSAAALACIF